MIINGITITTEAELESAIAEMNEESKVYLRNVFNGVENLPVVSKKLKIYALINNPRGNHSEPPFGVDYVTGLTTKLHRKQVMVKGEVQQELFYVNYNGTTYTDLVVKETHVYSRDAMGFAKFKTTIITWIYEDDTECEQKKTWVKYYDNLQMIEEGIQRRSNMIKALQPKVLGLLQMTLPPEEQPNILIYGRGFLSQMKDYFENFANHSDRSLYTELNNSALVTQFPWLSNQIPGMGGVTILMFILNEVTI